MGRRERQRMRGYAETERRKGERREKKFGAPFLIVHNRMRGYAVTERRKRERREKKFGASFVIVHNQHSSLLKYNLCLLNLLLDYCIL